jgi:transcriptional regulator with XRE-family HTH domain
MRDALIGKTLRALRHRRGWRQIDLATRAHVSRSVLAELEAGRIGAHALDALRRSAEACGGRLDVELRVPGGDLARLLDEDHARVQSAWAEYLAADGWQASVEVTFNHYGERGSIDILAWHPGERVLLLCEVKTVIVDAQTLLSAIDRKVRIAAVLARERGWHPRAAVPALIVLEGSTARRRVKEHAALFARFAMVGRAAGAWMRRPAGGTAPSGLLLFHKLSDARSGDRRQAGRQRVRLSKGSSRSERA